MVINQQLQHKVMQTEDQTADRQAGGQFQLPLQLHNNRWKK